MNFYVYDVIILLCVLVFYKVLQDFDQKNARRSSLAVPCQAFWAQTLNTGFAWSSRHKIKNDHAERENKGKTNTVNLPNTKIQINATCFSRFFGL